MKMTQPESLRDRLRALSGSSWPLVLLPAVLQTLVLACFLLGFAPATLFRPETTPDRLLASPAVNLALLVFLWAGLAMAVFGGRVWLSGIARPFGYLLIAVAIASFAAFDPGLGFMYILAGAQLIRHNLRAHAGSA